MNVLRTLAVSTLVTGAGLPLAFLAFGVTDTSLLGTLGVLGAVIGFVSGIIAGVISPKRIENDGYYTRTYGKK